MKKELLIYICIKIKLKNQKYTIKKFTKIYIFSVAFYVVVLPFMQKARISKMLF